MVDPLDLTFDEGLALLEQYPDLNDIRDAAYALCVIEQCLEALSREPGLYDTLKQAHSAKSYGRVVNSSFIRRPKPPRRAGDKMTEIRPLLEAFVRSDDPPNLWAPSQPTTPEILAHATSLKLRTIKGFNVPLVILQDLGSFSSDDLLGARVKNIFVRGKQTLLVNTSGSGKTRLMFEGLSREWRFYFTSVRDTSGLGSSDLQHILESSLPSGDFMDYPQRHSPDFAFVIATNNLLAENCFSKAFLARLLIFRMFLEVAVDSGITEEHESKWLLLQLRAGLETSKDIFERLTRCMWDADTLNIEENITDAIRDIYKLMGAETHLFFVLDEAQAAAEQSWAKHLAADDFSVVISGTAIPPEIFNDTSYAGRLRWTSDTDAFDDKTVQQSYLRRFLPPSFPDTDSGKAFLERVWNWTRGCHRFTAALIGELLANFQNPHTLLNNYIKTLSGFQPTDGQEYVRAEINTGRKMIFNTFDFSLLDSDSSCALPTPHAATRIVVQEVLYNYLTTNEHPPVFNKEHITAVSLDHGRFVDGNMSQIVINEPIVLAGAAVWLNLPPKSTLYPVPYGATLRHYPPSSPKMFAKCLAFYFVHAFKAKPKLSDVFTFTDATNPVSSWAKQSAELVELHPSDEEPAPAERYLEHNDRTTFCIPALGNPDLLFALKLADGSFVWVIVQATPSTSDGVDLLTALDEEYLMRDDESVQARDEGLVNHNRALEILNSPPVATSSKRSLKRSSPTVLRVVASFENQINLPISEGASPHASLSMAHFHHVTEAIKPAEVVASMVASVLGKRKEAANTGKGEGSSRGTKRRKSSPVAIEAPEEEKKARIEKGKGKEKETAAVKAKPPSAREAPVSDRVLRSRTKLSKDDVEVGTKRKSAGKKPKSLTERKGKSA
ncbi:hypothetical protein C8J57DRAFT_1733490 [Mycena rebaudengoi]|nr:hypothetical protein C8J57DRAFT_1733490 [Mycena rebaudengoi]